VWRAPLSLDSDRSLTIWDQFENIAAKSPVRDHGGAQLVVDELDLAPPAAAEISIPQGENVFAA